MTAARSASRSERRADLVGGVQHDRRNRRARALRTLLCQPRAMFSRRYPHRRPPRQGERQAGERDRVERLARRSSASAAATSETGIVTSTISTGRHCMSTATSANARKQGSDDDRRVMLSIASSMNVAGRTTEVSVWSPASPGFSFSSADSTPLVTSLALAPGNFSTTSSRPSPSLTTASPISGDDPRRRSRRPSGAAGRQNPRREPCRAPWDRRSCRRRCEPAGAAAASR